MAKVGKGKAEQGEDTRTTLVATARELFADNGYGATSTEEIVRQASVTRGALYYHFDDKKDLFRAVYETVEEDVIAGIAETMSGQSDISQTMSSGALAFLDICTRPEIARIALVDAPSVLGWQQWREIDLRYGLGLVTAALQAAMDAGLYRVQEVRPLAHLLMGAMSEAGMLIANSDDPARAREEIEPPLLSLLEGLKETPGPAADASG